MKLKKLDVHIEINADTLERAVRTGHLRLLTNVLKGTAKGVMQGLEIGKITLSPWEGYTDYVPDE